MSGTAPAAAHESGPCFTALRRELAKLARRIDEIGDRYRDMGARYRQLAEETDELIEEEMRLLLVCARESLCPPDCRRCVAEGQKGVVQP